MTVNLIGPAGSSGPRVLGTAQAPQQTTAQSDKGFLDLEGLFGRGQRDVFTLECPQLGPIHRVTVESNGKGLGSDWMLGKLAE